MRTQTNGWTTAEVVKSTERSLQMFYPKHMVLSRAKWLSWTSTGSSRSVLGYNKNQFFQTSNVIRHFPASWKNPWRTRIFLFSFFPLLFFSLFFFLLFSLLNLSVSLSFSPPLFSSPFLSLADQKVFWAFRVISTSCTLNWHIVHICNIFWVCVWAYVCMCIEINAKILSDLPNSWEAEPWSQI